ncbi:MAG: hypothetical protein AB1714_16055 [Acidobacteriota bacterium]
MESEEVPDLRLLLQFCLDLGDELFLSVVDFVLRFVVALPFLFSATFKLSCLTMKTEFGFEVSRLASFLVLGSNVPVQFLQFRL